MLQLNAVFHYFIVSAGRPQGNRRTVKMFAIKCYYENVLDYTANITVSLFTKQQTKNTKTTTNVLWLDAKI